MQLIQQEQEWRRPPEPQKLPSGKDAQVVLARWSAPQASRALEYVSDQAVASHVVSIALRPTRSELLIGSKTMKAGTVAAGVTLLAGPISQPCSAVFFEGFDFLQVYLSPGLMDECYEAAHGRPPAADVTPISPHYTSDVIIRTLARLLASPDMHGGPLGLIFIESVGLAIATRLLGIGSPGLSALTASNHAPLAKWRLKRTLDYIEANIEKSMSLAELSRVADLSRMHFAAQFKVATGQSPHAYVTSRKIERAKQLLKDGKLSIGHVAIALDFNSSAHFTQVFKRLVGETPSNWRRRLDV
jgi:AraC family transcriptional regulator